MINIKGKKAALVIDNYFEEAEFTGPLAALQEAGADVDVIGLRLGKVQSMKHAEMSESYPVDKIIDEI